jgi:squalene-hopene/tetraprenyl-beta-curcumene cyclase
MRRSLVWAGCASMVVLGMIGRASATDAEHKAKAAAMIDKAVAWLKTQQDAESGGWSIPQAPEPEAAAPGEAAPPPPPPHLPAITGLVLTGMLLDPKADMNDRAIAGGVKYLLNHQQPDGGIYDRMLPSYNTSIGVSALSRVDTPRANEAVQKGVEFLRKLQWGEQASPEVGASEAAKPVERDHPFYGGVGYGRHGRPDNSNMNQFMQALQDAGVSSDDEAVKRALVFLERTQMLDEVNEMTYADGSRQGGFVYATVENAQSVDGRAGQSMAGTTEETLDDGTKVSRLRAYGSMTYAGFKSYIYADMPRDDVRVKAALGWIQRHYTVEENPGMGTDGLYYYYVTFARALDAFGPDTIDIVKDAKGTSFDSPGTAESRVWGNDLIDRLAALQNDDGSFRSVDDRWMENNPVLITAYAVIALRHASN